jgi:hypothetical protein
MNRTAEKHDQVGAFKRLFLYVLLPLTVLMAAALGTAYVGDLSVSDLLRDPSAVLDGPWYVGVFSTTGIALWAVAGALCLLTLSSEPSKGARSLLIAGAVMSFVLGADDGYLLHETIKNEIGIPSPVTIGIYGVLAIVLFWPAWRYLRSRPEFMVFVTAVALLATSAILDFAGEAGLPTPPLSPIIEDVAKFLGIATWAAFFAWVCASLIRERAAVTNPTH